MLLKQSNSLLLLVSLLVKSSGQVFFAKFSAVLDKLPICLLILFQIHPNTYATLALPGSSIISSGWTRAADRDFRGSNDSRTGAGGGDRSILPRTCLDGVG
ncbi:MAG: hypothetical protein DCF15_19115 [Phormidesmis priestleyi]|uniref:Uncharacterized protein n=1 Tax=Phormidesmis priestleyi TaxID=268141 RepID=A0A2W4WS61_9CYAN|nr:MAG: hypothetical protein DCF15_19115 [Phormidesmis priestleyi]